MLNMPYVMFSQGHITLLNFNQLLLLGAFAGLTIFLGLPLAVIQSIGTKKKGFLNALAIGILIFLIVDVFGHAWEATQNIANRALAGTASVGDAMLALFAMFGGLAIGLLGLTVYGSRFMNQSFVHSPIVAGVAAGRGIAGGEQELQLYQQLDARRMSMMIAVGIGAHNFSEGLAIGQSYALGAIGLAVMLIIGFAAHNTTEGFGIAAPLTGLSKRHSNRFLLLAGLVGGGPTFLGTAVGGLWASSIAYIFFLSVAGGALVYVSMLMYTSGRRQVANDVLMLGFFVGLVAGFLTDLLVTLGGA
jgi:ZIP family zinc transporter